MKLYQAIVQNYRLLNADTVCEDERVFEREERIGAALPRGSGIDAGTTIESVSDKQIRMTAGYHHMNEGGYYDGWTEHSILVRPSLMHGMTVTVSGPNRNGIVDYLQQVYYECMNQEFAWLVPLVLHGDEVPAL